MDKDQLSELTKEYTLNLALMECKREAIKAYQSFIPIAEIAQSRDYTLSSLYAINKDIEKMTADLKTMEERTAEIKKVMIDNGFKDYHFTLISAFVDNPKMEV